MKECIKLKLEFLKQSASYLRPALRETRSMEETAEAIIPDSCPDVTEVLFTSGMAFLRGKELTEGILSISAGVSATALTQPEGRKTPEVVEVYIPMSLKLENSVLKPGMETRVQVTLRRLDGHLVNPRKIMVRATIAVCATVYEPATEEHLDGTQDKRVCLLRKTAPVRWLSALGEKNYTVEDTVRLSPEGLAENLAGYQVELTHADSRLTGARAVLKGECRLYALYMDGDGRMQTGSATLPFSQYIDLGDCQETDELKIKSCLTGADVELSADGGSLNVTLQLLTTAEVFSRREISYVGDIYALDGEITPETAQRSYDSLLDCQYFAPVGHGNADGQANRVIYVNCLTGETSEKRSGEQIEFTLPVTAQILWENDQGQLRSSSVRTELTATTRASEGCRFEAETTSLTASGSPGMDDMDIKVNGTMAVSTYRPMDFLEIIGGNLEEMEQEHSAPGLIIRQPRREESLWDIAKEYHTTQEAILAANGLSEDAAPEGILLIPR